MTIQAEKSMANLITCVTTAGAKLTSILKLTTFVTSFEDYKIIAQVRAKYIPQPYPASTMVQVVRLNDPSLLIEIEAIVAL